MGNRDLVSTHMLLIVALGVAMIIISSSNLQFLLGVLTAFFGIAFYMYLKLSPSSVKKLQQANVFTTVMYVCGMGLAFILTAYITTLLGSVEPNNFLSPEFTFPYIIGGAIFGTLLGGGRPLIFQKIDNKTVANTLINPVLVLIFVVFVRFEPSVGSIFAVMFLFSYGISSLYVLNDMSNA